MTTRSKPEVAPRSALDEALFHLAEECCELGKAASKVYRFGPDHRKKKDGPTNEERLFEEYADVEYWVQAVAAILTQQYDAQKKTPAKDNLDGGYYMGFPLGSTLNEAYAELSDHRSTTPQT